MGSGNWVVDVLNNAIETWSNMFGQIWDLITTSPASFKGGAIWDIIVDIHGGLKAIAYALLVLFFVIGVVKTTTNFSELKRPEQALKLSYALQSQRWLLPTVWISCLQYSASYRV